MRVLRTEHGDLASPSFLPDGTRGVVKAVGPSDLEACRIRGLVVNTLHLSSNPGTTVISALGGIHRFMAWNGPIISDSGGFQIFSLIAESSGVGSVSGDGFTYRLDKGKSRKKLTPEGCIRKQFQIGSDVMFCLDHCTHPDAGLKVQLESVEHTIAWARRCKAEYDRQMQRRDASGERPLLFAVVQGGAEPDLRRMCAERLLELGFDGFGYGGWPVDRSGTLTEMVEYVSELIPDEFPRHALGIGKPESAARAFRLGYDLFDCSIPTREARHRRLYVFNDDPARLDLHAGDFYSLMHMRDRKYVRDSTPVDQHCDCVCCQSYSRAYLRHLFGVDDSLAFRLATMHNLRFYTRLMEQLGAERDQARNSRQAQAVEEIR